MSERQQIVTKYTLNIAPRFAVLYELNFLRIEKDSAAIEMLQESIKAIAEEGNYEVIKNLLPNVKYGKPLESIICGPYIETEKKQTKKERAGFHAEGVGEETCGRSYYDRFMYGNALHDIEKAIKKSNEKYYVERCICNFALQNYSQARYFALKSGENTLLFLMSMASGHFSEAADCYENGVLSKRISNNQIIIGTNDLFRLIMLSVMASRPATKVVETYEKLMNSVYESKIQIFQDIVYEMQTNNYGGVVRLISQLSESVNQSIYTVGSADKLMAALYQNSLVSYVRPFASIRISDIKEATGLNEKEIMFYISKGVREGEISGRIDQKEGIFVKNDSNYVQKRELTSKLDVIRQRFELGKWCSVTKKELKL